MPIQNITEVDQITEEIAANTPDIVGEIIRNLYTTLKPILAIIGGLIGIYIIYLIINYISSYKKNRRIKITYKNSKKILEKLEAIEKKLDKLERERITTKSKPTKKYKKQSRLKKAEKKKKSK